MAMYVNTETNLVIESNHNHTKRPGQRAIHCLKPVYNGSTMLSISGSSNIVLFSNFCSFLSRHVCTFRLTIDTGHSPLTLPYLHFHGDPSYDDNFNFSQKCQYPFAQNCHFVSFQLIFNHFGPNQINATLSTLSW